MEKKVWEFKKKIILIMLVFLSLSILVNANSIKNNGTKKKIYQKKHLGNKNNTKKVNKGKTTTTGKKQVNKVNQKNVNVEKEVYLTFDDGPSTNNTPKILEILRKNNIKATFFVIGKNPDYYKRIIDEGHTIGLHSFSHDYKEIYSSEAAFFKDLYKLRDLVKAKTGIDSKITRFPGGSSNSKASKGLKTAIINRLTREGYVYYDWNCDSTDASAVKVSSNQIATKSYCNLNKVNLLMHDSIPKTTTVEALQRIIDKYKNEGYKFRTLDKTSTKIQHVKQPI